MSQQVSRRQFYKAALAALGGGTIALLFSQAGGGGIGAETDPLAVLKSPTTGQTIQPQASGFDGTLGRILRFLDPTGLRGFSIVSDELVGLAPQFHLLRQTSDSPQSMFIIESLDTGLQQAVITYDPSNLLGFGNNALIFGDDGTVSGTGFLTLGFLGTNFDLTRLLGAANGPGGTSSIAAGSAGLANGTARPDHTHQISTSALGTPSAVGLVGTRGSSLLLPRFDHAHKGVVSIQDNRQTAQTAAIASLLAFTVGAADGLFRIQGNVNITTFVAGTFNMTVAYTDETNTARTLTLNFSSLTGTLGVAIAAAGPFEGIPTVIRCKASTTITVATSGTFTSLTYNAEAMLEQLA